ncbi:MAG: family 10 glycosylhydrolase [Bryobacteraceae bacterium]
MRHSVARRFLWMMPLLVVLAVGVITAKAAGRRPVLYNGDGDWFYWTGPEDMDRAYLEDIVNRLAAAHVTIHSEVFYDGGHCFYDTRAGVRFDKDPDYRLSPATNRFTVLEAWRMVNNFRRLLSQGNEPLKVFVETSHKKGLKFLACVRMNDRHDFNVKHPPLPVRGHPEMAMKRLNGSVIGGMDFQHAEVRDFVFKPMEEMVRKYDVDGLELDWMRWVQMFSEDVPREKRAAVLTGYHRRIRKMLDDAGKQKGKHLLLSVRVPSTLEECAASGYDVEAYVREGLIDILCPSDFIVLDPHLRVDPFLKITGGTKILTLPSLHAPTGFKSGIPATENIRAVAHSYYRQGADGISVYNWFTPREINLPENFPALAEASDPEALAKLPREYLFNPMWGRKSQTGRLIDYKAQVPRSSPGKREVFPFLIKEDLDTTRTALKLKIENLTLLDEIRLDVNGTPLRPEHYKRSYLAAGKRGDARWLDAGWEAGPYYLFEVNHAGRWLRDGDNEIGLTLLKPNPAVDLPITLFEVRVGVWPR